MMYANKLMERAKVRKNEIHFLKVGEIDKQVVYGLCDACYTAGGGKNSTIGSQFIILGT